MTTKITTTPSPLEVVDKINVLVDESSTNATNITSAKNASITGLSVSGKVITYTKGNGTTGTITTQDTTYTLPTASSTLGGVKTTSTVTSTSGLTACPIISGVPYYKDTNTTYTAMTASEATTGTSGTARTISAKVLHDKISSMTNTTGNSFDWKYNTGDGSDGAFKPSSNTTIQGLKQYTSVNIKSGITVTCSEKTVILCQGSCTITGTLTGTAAIPGGSGRGVRGTAGHNDGGGVAGLGGAGNSAGGAGGAATERLFPFNWYAENGGSGGSGGSEDGKGSTYGAGGAGGAGITIVAKTITVSGTISSNGTNGVNGGYHSGGGGGGGGGNIFLVADSITKTGTITSTPGTGGWYHSADFGYAENGTAGTIKEIIRGA